MHHPQRPNRHPPPRLVTIPAHPPTPARRARGIASTSPRRAPLDVLCPNGLFDLASLSVGRTTSTGERPSTSSAVAPKGMSGWSGRSGRSRVSTGRRGSARRSPSLPSRRKGTFRRCERSGSATTTKSESLGSTKSTRAASSIRRTPAPAAGRLMVGLSSPRPPPFEVGNQTVMYGWGAPGSEWYWLTTGPCTGGVGRPVGSHSLAHNRPGCVHG